ncbi:hypothetical protein TKK_0002132 [Trichogramma kaykai]|uniref:phospholipase A1 n=1 Tax=Trichogramma kaykai TaxID=54128 RepID=A0ABD2XB03_9HYME
MASIVVPLLLLYFTTHAYAAGVSAVLGDQSTDALQWAEQQILTILSPAAVPADDRSSVFNPINLLSSVVDQQAPASSIRITERDIGYYFYTNEQPELNVPLTSGDSTSLRSLANVSGQTPLKVVIHGWTDTGSAAWMHDIRRNYLKSGNYNVVIVDWSVGSTKDYLTSTRLTRTVAEYAAKFLEFLVAEGVCRMDKIHILGHSLGAHIAGLIGYQLQGQLGRITGMDPARPDFEAPVLKDPRDRLDWTDARFVDVVHTCAGTAGFVRPIGHADFYPNGGSFRQPGCPVFMIQYCSHGRSHQFVAESIVNPRGFQAVECGTWKDYKAQKCAKNKLVYMGEALDPEIRSIFFLETNAEPPYGRGDIV